MNSGSASLFPELTALPLPRWRLVKRRFPVHEAASPATVVAAQLARPEVRSQIRPGDRVAVGVGSRGIARLPEIVGALIRGLKQLEARPFIVPAMGSHGGANSEGQIAVLLGLGISEASMGVPIRASMDTVELGVAGGATVAFDRLSLTEADAVIPVNRVKPHTDFHGEVESGLLKMLGLGFGKHSGASHLHAFPVEGFGMLVSTVGRFILSKVRVPFGVAVVEDAHEQAALIECVPGNEICTREPQLLLRAREWLPLLPCRNLDVLVVQEMGKNIAGTGMDANVTGRCTRPEIHDHVAIRRLVVLDLTAQTEGNATGVGYADIVTTRLAQKIDWAKTYRNHVTARSLEGCKLPVVAATDREAIAIAAVTLNGMERARISEKLQIAWIKNTRELTRMFVSEALFAELSDRRDIEPASELGEMRFEPDGTLENFSEALG